VSEIKEGMLAIAAIQTFPARRKRVFRKRQGEGKSMTLTWLALKESAKANQDKTALVKEESHGY
jgi:hypothetical protein